MARHRPRGLEPFRELSQFDIHGPSVKLLPYRFCLTHLVVVLGQVDQEADHPIILGVLDPADENLLRKVETALGRSIDPTQMSAYEIHKALDSGHGFEEDQLLIQRMELEPVEAITFNAENQAQDLVCQLLSRALTLGASDVHLECYEDDVDVRVRLNGTLHHLPSSVTPNLMPMVVSHMKILAGLDIAEKRRAQDGRLQAVFTDEAGIRPIDFRLSIVPGPFGEDAVLRILDSSQPLVGLNRLGFVDEALDIFRKLVANPEGLILVTGPTGSGKTTTLYSAMEEINTEHNKVLTAEDPIEYLFPKMNQHQVGPTMGFADFARSFLRQDPDVMLIGEIRDEETADISFRAAQTGHMVLTTLHTNHAVGALSRLKTLGVAAPLIADTLLGVLAQRLVRKLCPDCRQPAEPDAFAEEIFVKTGETWPLWMGKGCDLCHGTGYQGRFGIFELFVVDGDMAERIAAGQTDGEIRMAARRAGMVTLFDDALAKVRQGLTTLEEVRRTVPYRLINEKAVDGA